MFSLKVEKTKIKKKIKKRIKLNFITGIKRVLVCINILKFLIILKKKRKKKNLNFNFFEPIYTFLVNNNNTPVDFVKFRIYRHKLIQMKRS
jgi:hypothetical protein